MYQHQLVSHEHVWCTCTVVKLVGLLLWLSFNIIYQSHHYDYEYDKTYVKKSHNTQWKPVISLPQKVAHYKVAHYKVAPYQSCKLSESPTEKVTPYFIPYFIWVIWVWTKKNLLQRDLNQRHPTGYQQNLPISQYLCSGVPVRSHSTVSCHAARDHTQVLQYNLGSGSHGITLWGWEFLLINIK